ncbi:MAG: ABC transporter ATP-binding protein [Acidimicrobiia bacterium]
MTPDRSSPPDDTADLSPVDTASLTLESTIDSGNGPLLSVRDLSVSFQTDDGLVRAVDSVTFDVHENETVGIVGESGSGKSVSSLAILGLLPRSAKITGDIVFRGQSLPALSEKEMEKIRGKEIAMIFQDALAALNPVYSVGKQIAEAIAVHDRDVDKQTLRERSIELLDLVGIPNPSERVDQYPHEYSGGMRQRAMIAMAISNDPALLIADEPTTALDVTIQAQVLEVLERIQDRTRAAIMLITHDLGVVAGVVERVVVMYGGRQVELGSVDDTFYDPKHPYTEGLLASLPRLDRRSDKHTRLHRIVGQPPSLIHLPSGCAFHPRCPYAEVPGRCSEDRPELAEVAPGHRSACFFPERVGSLVEEPA